MKITLNREQLAKAMYDTTIRWLDKNYRKKQPTLPWDELTDFGKQLYYRLADAVVAEILGINSDTWQPTLTSE